MASSIRPFSTRRIRSSTCGLIDMVRYLRERGEWLGLRGLTCARGGCLTTSGGVGRVGSGEAIREEAIDRQRAAAVDGDDAGEPNDDEVILEPFGAGGQAAEPVHEEPVRHVRGDRADHQADNAERGESTAESENQCKWGDELRDDRECRERGGEAERVGHPAEGAAEAVPAEEAEGVLESVRDEEGAEHDASEKGAAVVVGGDECAVHGILRLYVRAIVARACISCDPERSADS